MIEHTTCPTCGGARPTEPIRHEHDVAGLELCSCTTWIVVTEEQRENLQEKVNVMSRGKGVKPLAAKKEHTTEDSIAEIKAVAEAQNAGSWRIVQPSGSQPVPHFVRFSEADQYNLLTPDEYKSEKRAALALALVTRPTQLTYQERAALLEILLDKE